MQAAFPKVIANLPERMTYLDMADPNADGGLPEKPGPVILAGGEVLSKQVREAVLYPAVVLLHEKYRNNGGVEIVVQTTSDLVTDKIIDELMDRHVGGSWCLGWMLTMRVSKPRQQGTSFKKSSRECSKPTG